MNYKKILTGVAAIMAGLSLTACQNNKEKTTAKTPTLSKVKKTAPKKLGTLKAQNLSPQETVSVVTAYAGKKYGENWQTVMSKAQESKLQVTFDQRSDHPSITKGQGYVYVVGADGADDTKTYYTLEGSGQSQIIYFYQGAKYLGQSTIKDIIKYLNKLNCDDLVQKLSKTAEVGGQSTDDSSDSNESSDDNSSSSDTKKSDLPGDAGIFTVPSNLRGTWYSDDDGKIETLKVTAHKLIAQGNNTELHKQKSNFDGSKYTKFAESHAILEYGAASNYNQNGFSGFEYRNWTGGVNNLCVSHSENGQPVVLFYEASSGLEPADIYWQSVELAKKYSGKHFTDLRKIDREVIDKEIQDGE